MDFEYFKENCGNHLESFEIDDKINCLSTTIKVREVGCMNGSISKGILLDCSLPLTSCDMTRLVVTFDLSREVPALTFTVKSKINWKWQISKIWLLGSDVPEKKCLVWVKEAISDFVIHEKVRDVYSVWFVQAAIACVSSYEKIHYGNTRSITFVDGEASEIYKAAPNTVLANTVKEFVGDMKEEITVNLDLCGEAIADIKKGYKSWGKDIGIIDHLHQMFHVSIP